MTMIIKKTNIELPSCAVILLMAAVHQYDQECYPRSVGAEYLNSGLQDHDGYYWAATHRNAQDETGSTEVIVLEKIKRDNETFSAIETTIYQFEMRALRKLLVVVKLVSFADDQLTISESAKVKRGRKVSANV